MKKILACLMICVVGGMVWSCMQLQQINTTTNQIYTHIHQVRNPKNTLFNKAWLFSHIKRVIPPAMEEFRFSEQFFAIIESKSKDAVRQEIELHLGELLGAFAGSISDAWIEEKVETLAHQQDDFDYPISLLLMSFADSIAQAQNKDPTRFPLPEETKSVLRNLHVMYQDQLSKSMRDRLGTRNNVYYTGTYENLNYDHAISLHASSVNNEVIAYATALLVEKISTQEAHRLEYLFILAGCTFFLLILAWYQIGHGKVSKFGGIFLNLVYLGFITQYITMSLVTMEAWIEKVSINVLVPIEANNIQILTLNKSIWETFLHIEGNTPESWILRCVLIGFSVILPVCIVLIGSYCIIYPTKIKQWMDDIMSFKILLSVEILMMMFLALFFTQDMIIKSYFSVHEGNGSEDFISIMLDSTSTYRSGIYVWMIAFCFAVGKHWIMKRKYFVGIVRTFTNILAK